MEITVAQTPAPMRPRDYNSSQLQLVKRTVAKDCTNDEFDMFIEIAKRQGLDPFRKQIYAFVFHKDDAEKRQFVPVTGIDGYRAIAKRTGQYRPSDQEPDIEFDEKLKSEWNPKGIKSARVIVYQYGPDKQWYPIIGKAAWDEFAPLIEEGEWVPMLDNSGNQILQTEGKWRGKPKRKKVGNGTFKLTKDNWKTMPEVMIAKCAEAQALRKGWPEEYSGTYVFEEMDRMEATASEVVEEFEEQQRLVAVNGLSSFPLIFDFSRGIEMVNRGAIADRVIEHVSAFETASEIDVWMESNRVGLQQYWAKEKSEALELKKKIEEIQKTKPKHKDMQGA